MPVDFLRTKRELDVLFDDLQAAPMSSQLSPNSEDDSGLEATVDQAIAACGGDLRATIRALIVANEYLEHEVSELMKAVSHAYARGRFNAYAG
jgi:DNA anti-recombination protein RmuC